MLERVEGQSWHCAVLGLLFRWTQCAPQDCMFYFICTSSLISSLSFEFHFLRGDSAVLLCQLTQCVTICRVTKLGLLLMLKALTQHAGQTYLLSPTSNSINI